MELSLHRFRELFRDHEEIYQEIYENRQFNAVYLMMLVMATMIAMLGLLLNSPAVIIGAMLISPLMGPILSVGLSLTVADWKLARKSAINIALSFVEAVVISALITAISPLKDATPEILARTQPNLMDLLVAVFSGVAGTLALTSRKGGLTIIPGVAIATAVIPPLSIVGYGLATAQWQVAGGAFMLFFTNLMAIVVSADLIFLLVGFRPAERMTEEDRQKLIGKRILVSTLVLLLLSLPLLRTLMRAAQQAKVRDGISDVLRKRLGDRARVAALDFRMLEDKVVVEADLRTTRYIDASEVKQMEEVLGARVGRPVQLNLQQVHVEQPGAQPRGDYVGGGTVRPVAPKPPPSPSVVVAEVQSKIDSLLQQLARPMVESVRVRAVGRQPDDVLLIDVNGRQPQPTNAGAWAVVAAALARDLGARVELQATLVTAVQDANLIRFPAGKTTPNAADVRRARALLAQFPDDPRVKLAFTASAQADRQLTARRLAALAAEFRDISDTLALAPELPPESMAFYLLQTVDVTGESALGVSSSALENVRQEETAASTP